MNEDEMNEQENPYELERPIPWELKVCFWLIIVCLVLSVIL